MNSNPPVKLQELIGLKQSEDYWLKEGQKFSLETFKLVSGRVSAYKRFLKNNKIDPQKIRSIKDFAGLPLTEKQNYIDKFPLNELVLDGKITSAQLINSSSGTTGKPYYWPSAPNELNEAAAIHEYIYTQNFGIKKLKTLLIVCFGMGTWIAGTYTSITGQLIHQKGYPITVITPGFNQEEALRILENLGSEFDQCIIAGIPTFVKDLLEKWKENRVSKKVNLRLLFAGEGNSQSFREYALDLINSKNKIDDCISVFGSADFGVMGFESALTIYIREIASKNPQLCQILFGQERVPTLYNFLPNWRYFECVNGQLVLTARRTVPLVRYNIHDEGGILTYGKIKTILNDFGITIDDRKFIKLPMVYLFGRGKFTATLYGVNVYPENVKEVLIEKSLQKSLTGAFTLETKYTKLTQKQYLQLNVELVQKFSGDKRKLSKKIEKKFVEVVRKLNSEYNKMYGEYKHRAVPKVNILKYGDTNYFPKDKIRKMS